MTTVTAAQAVEEKRPRRLSAVVAADIPVLAFAPSTLNVSDFKASKVRANPYDDIVLRSFNAKQAFEAAVPHAAGGNVNEEVEAQISLLKSAARFHKVGLTYHVIEGASDADRRIWFLAKPRQTRKSKASIAA